MAASLQDLFGSQAYETQTQLFVSLTDLQAVGLEDNQDNFRCIAAAIISLAYHHYLSVELTENYTGLHLSQFIFLDSENFRFFKFQVKHYAAV